MTSFPLEKDKKTKFKTQKEPMLIIKSSEFTNLIS